VYDPDVSDVESPPSPPGEEREARSRRARLVAAGAVGASVAHELRNALAVAESAVFLARRDVDDRERVLAHLDQVGAEIRKAHAVIGSVLGLARGEPPRRERVRLASLVDVARHAIVLPTNVTFQVAVEPELEVWCDPILIERVFSNLYLNAVDALEGRGRGAISTRAHVEGERVWIEVRDDGRGLTDASRATLFEPLVTDKPTGTGLGLSLSQVIVEAHGGEISASAHPGGGASFRFWLPQMGTA
jgi:signal transduction histidine kinase